VTYRIVVKPSARKELEALPDPILRRMDEAIVALAGEPRPRGCVKVRGTSLHRIRVGDYRALYRVNDQTRLVEIIGIGHRRDVYR
jgi:mRNA interferase RelE/StbE